VIRNIRLLGAALGGLVGLTLAASARLFEASPNGGVLLAAWVVAWVVVGFAILPYLTVVPAGWLIRQIEQLSTAEFVTAVVGLLIGLLMGLLLGLPLSQLGGPATPEIPGMEVIAVGSLREAIEAALSASAGESRPSAMLMRKKIATPAPGIQNAYCHGKPSRMSGTPWNASRSPRRISTPNTPENVPRSRTWNQWALILTIESAPNAWK